MQRIEDYFTPEMIRFLRTSIEEAEGNEVLFSGKADQNGIVNEIILAARGKEDTVPVIESVIDFGDVLIHNHPNGLLVPSEADLDVAGRLGRHGIGAYIIDNQATRLYVVAEIIKRNKKELLDIDEAAGYLDDGGALSQNVEDYEARPQQIDFLKAVCSSFNKDNITIAEAGTGVGKSFAYLIPAFKWAEKNKERVIISTGTINLQHQLLEKDIPVIQKLLGTKLKAVLVKGRQNYLCLRRFNDRLQEAGLFDNEADFKAIEKWLEVTKTGERSDLTFFPTWELWSDICSESESCLGIKCPYRDKCFVIKSRKEATGASIIVVNHHLLFSDMEARMEDDFNGTSILPNYSRVIFDEAHNLENAATSYFSQSVNKGYILKVMHQIYRRVKDRIFGIYRFWSYYTEQKTKLESIPQQIAVIISRTDDLEKVIQANVLMNDNSPVLDMRSDTINASDIYEAVGNLRNEVNDLFNIITDIHEELSKMPDKEVKNDKRMYETSIVKNKLSGIISMLNDFIANQETCINYIEKGKKYSSLFIAPLSVSETLREIIFNRLSNVVLVSATLSVNKSFEFYATRIGLHDVDRPVARFIFDSPFEYKKNVLLSIPSDLPEPKSADYSQKLSDLIKNVLIISEGKGLVLFTSYSMLKTVYDLVRDDFSNAGITLFKQGDDDNKKLLGNFFINKNSVLFATDSFWEGVDVPGESLSVLIICRLPFKVPSDPVIKARMELIEKNGGNSFLEYSLPEAVIKLRQGFGRLIRRKSDRGVILITDTRILSKFYGKIFFNSLPETRRDITSSDRICLKIEDFLYS
ncbi:MAG: DEAD/DEAH box helicase family protein [Spirochaetales bacterium]|nr:DEAD/DEAH box helicase family protein [Spirochaetales bacterium]